MCYICEEKKCKPSCSHRKRPCEAPKPCPCPCPCPCPPKSASAISRGLSGANAPISENGVILFNNSNNGSSSVVFEGGVARIDEPGDYLVEVILTLTADDDTTNTTTTDDKTATTLVRTEQSQVALYLLDSSSGISCSPCGGCSNWRSVPATDINPGQNGLTLVQDSIHSPAFGSTRIKISEVVKVAKRCQQLLLYNSSHKIVTTVKSTKVQGEPAPRIDTTTVESPSTIVLNRNIADASFSVVKVAKTGC